MRLCRPMSGKALPFRQNGKKIGGSASKSEAEPRVNLGGRDGEPQAHRSSGGTAASDQLVT